MLDIRRPGKSLWEYLDELLGENAELRGDIGELRNELESLKGAVMSQLSDLKADVATLKLERDEIVAFIESKAVELATANGKVQELLAKIAELEQNVVSPEEIAAVRADVQSVTDSLNSYTPPAPGPIEPEPEPPIEETPQP